jgi:hypothetical protein
MITRDIAQAKSFEVHQNYIQKLSWYCTERIHCVSIVEFVWSTENNRCLLENLYEIPCVDKMQRILMLKTRLMLMLIHGKNAETWRWIEEFSWKESATIRVAWPYSFLLGVFEKGPFFLQVLKTTRRPITPKFAALLRSMGVWQCMHNWANVWAVFTIKWQYVPFIAVGQVMAIGKWNWPWNTDICPKNQV